MDYFVFILFLIYVVILIFIFKKNKTKYSNLVEAFKAHYSFLGLIKFNFNNKKFELTQVGTGNVNTGFGGSYHKLLLEIDKPIRFFLGPELSYKYVSIRSVPDNFLKFEINQRQFILDFYENELAQTFKNKLLQNNELKNTLLNLLQKDFQYLNSSSKIIFENLKFKRKYYLELSFIDHACIDSSDQLIEVIKKFSYIHDLLLN